MEIVAMPNNINEDEVFLTQEITVKEVYDSILAVQKTLKTHGGQLDGIEKQTKLTNGRVTCLEQRMQTVEEASIVLFFKKYKKIIWMLVGIGIYLGISGIWGNAKTLFGGQ